MKPGEKKMTFKPPQLTEAEEKEVFLPDSMKCDGCQAVATQWNRTFARAHLHKTGEWRLDEGEVMMMMGKSTRKCQADFESAKVTGEIPGMPRGYSCSQPAVVFLA